MNPGLISWRTLAGAVVISVMLAAGNGCEKPADKAPAATAKATGAAAPTSQPAKSSAEATGGVRELPAPSTRPQ